MKPIAFAVSALGAGVAIGVIARRAGALAPAPRPDELQPSGVVLAADSHDGIALCPPESPWPRDASQIIYAAPVFDVEQQSSRFVLLSLFPKSLLGTPIHGAFIVALVASWTPWLCAPLCAGLARDPAPRILEIDGRCGSTRGGETGRGDCWRILRTIMLDCPALPVPTS